MNWIKSEALLFWNWLGLKPKLPEGLAWRKGGFKYLGVVLGDEADMMKNWEGVLEKVKGRLAKWKWLAPNISYRGQILIVNNLVASSLWHKMACLDPL